MAQLAMSRGQSPGRVRGDRSMELRAGTTLSAMAQRDMSRGLSPGHVAKGHVAQLAMSGDSPRTRPGETWRG